MGQKAAASGINTAGAKILFNQYPKLRELFRSLASLDRMPHRQRTR